MGMEGGGELQVDWREGGDCYLLNYSLGAHFMACVLPPTRQPPKKKKLHGHGVANITKELTLQVPTLVHILNTIIYEESGGYEL